MKRKISKPYWQFYIIQASKLMLSIALCWITLGLFPIYGDQGGGGPNTIQEDRM